MAPFFAPPCRFANMDLGYNGILLMMVMKNRPNFASPGHYYPAVARIDEAGYSIERLYVCVCNNVAALEPCCSSTLV